MYTVNVFNAVTNELIDSRDFEFGTWKEIGFWLDHYGYISAGFYLKVYMVEVAKTSKHRENLMRKLAEF